jgi:hypothetical protein
MKSKASSRQIGAKAKAARFKRGKKRKEGKEEVRNWIPGFTVAAN